MSVIEYDRGPGGVRLAFRQDGASDSGGRCGFFWMGGFMSDMDGAKAETLAGLARETRRPSTRFDYSGHGSSAGEFLEGTISGWLEQSIHMFITHTIGRRVIVGSSMGGWLAALLAKTLLRDDPRHAGRIAGLVLIAPAFDMTANLMWDEMDTEARAALRDEGVWRRPSLYGSPYPITRKLIEDGARFLLFGTKLALPFPVRIIQGSIDHDVPPAHALKVFETLAGPDVTLTLVRGGDHRLSSPTQLEFLREVTLALAERGDGLGVA
jgi:pimeloyl-ACP methyl ester carboxylesterase